MITNHTQLLNALIEKYSLKSYLEIGVQNPWNNFDKVKCAVKYGVDPALKTNRQYIVGLYEYGFTSDEFFACLPETHPIFDLIFIDGLHTAEQVKRDFENSLRCLSDNGFIVIHDVLPENEEGTKVPRETKQWWGDVYKWAMTISEYDNISFITYNIDNGCMVVKKELNKPGKPFSITKGNSKYFIGQNWDLFKAFGRDILNVTDEVII